MTDTSDALLVWEIPYYPTYYFPTDDVDMGRLTATGRTDHSPSRGDGDVYDIEGRPGAATVYGDSPIEELKGRVRFEWGAMDAWFEEDEEVYVHARDPHTRVDILASSRHVRVEVDGVTVADSRSPRILFETGLPPRYYLPKTDVRFDLLKPTDTATHCPYKGQAEYWSVGDNKDIVWSYRTPLAESQKVAGLVSFYNEKVDIYLDDVLLDRPQTHF